MTLIESEMIRSNGRVEDIYTFLTDLNNHQKLMPVQVTGWSSDADSCSYTITGTGNLSLRVKERKPFTEIILEPNGKVPFQFLLKWIISGNDGQVTVKAALEAEMNPVIRAVASGPLKNFIDMQAGSLQKLFP